VIAAAQTEFPIKTAFILCMDRGFPVARNHAIVELASRLPDVVAVDLAGPYQPEGPTIAEWATLYEEAKSLGLKTTAHMAESDPNDIHPILFPFLDRIGHGIQIALRRPELLPELAARNICLEVCPTTYLRTNTMRSVAELAPVFSRCADAGVAISVATDNPALHGETGKIVNEYEKLVRADVIHFNDILAHAAVGHEYAFGKGEAGEIERSRGWRVEQ
jgi:adenosine deaminase